MRATPDKSTNSLRKKKAAPCFSYGVINQSQSWDSSCPIGEYGTRLTSSQPRALTCVCLSGLKQYRISITLGVTMKQSVATIPFFPEMLSRDRSPMWIVLIPCAVSEHDSIPFNPNQPCGRFPSWFLFCESSSGFLQPVMLTRNISSTLTTISNHLALPAFPTTWDEESASFCANTESSPQRRFNTWRVSPPGFRRTTLWWG